MKIINVTPGILPIPPNGWGAVEKIIWETHLCLKDLGYDSEILYLNDVPKDADIVHIHVANLANEAHRRGISYYFTMHDHHAYLYGKDSDTYRENLEAIRNAKKAFVPDEESDEDEVEDEEDKDEEDDVETEIEEPEEIEVPKEEKEEHKKPSGAHTVEKKGDKFYVVEDGGEKAEVEDAYQVVALDYGRLQDRHFAQEDAERRRARDGQRSREEQHGG